MHRYFSLITGLLSLAATCVGAGCTSPAPPRLPAVAIAITPVGNRPPSAEEIHRVHQALTPALLQMGALVAERRDVADFVITVSFTPATASAGSRVTVIGVEPTARFREATDGGDTPEAKEWRRRMREIEGWAGSQGRIYEYER